MPNQKEHCHPERAICAKDLNLCVLSTHQPTRNLRFLIAAGCRTLRF